MVKVLSAMAESSISSRQFIFEFIQWQLNQKRAGPVSCTMRHILKGESCINVHLIYYFSETLFFSIYSHAQSDMKSINVYRNDILIITVTAV